MKKMFVFLLLCLMTLTPFAWAVKEANDYIAAGNKLATEKKYNEAVKQYEEALKIDPKNNQISLILGLAYANTGALDEALKYTNLAAKTEPSYTAFYNLGLIYAAMRDTEKSIEAFNRALSFNPDSSAAEYRKGLVYSEAKAYEKAAGSFGRALTLNPQLDEARVGLVGAYLKLNNRAGALNQVEEFRKMKKDDFANILEARIKERT